MAGGEPPFATATEVVDVARRAEKDGYDSIWVPDHLIDMDGSRADPWSTLGYASAVTKTLRFYSAVTDYQKVHPAKLAQIIATLDELSNGRITLGMGAGERMNNSPFGVPWDDAPVRVETLKEYLEVVRLLWKSSPQSPVSFKGRHYSLRDAWIDQQTFTKPMPRICIGAMGSTLMLDFIGRHGDGWLPPLMTPEYYRARQKVIDDAALKAGRDPASIERAYWLYFMVDKGGPKDMVPDFVRSMKAVIASLSPIIVEKEAGVKLKRAKLDTNFQRLVVSRQLVKELDAQAQAIPDSLVYKICPIGGADEIISHIERAMDAGAEHFVLAATRGLPDQNLKVVRDKVLPYFRRPRGR